MILLVTPSPTYRNFEDEIFISWVGCNIPKSSLAFFMDILAFLHFYYYFIPIVIVILFASMFVEIFRTRVFVLEFTAYLDPEIGLD